MVNDMANLECSSKGDRRFSALYAKIRVNDVYDSIENHYQLSKIIKNVNTGEVFMCNDFKRVKHLQFLNEYKIVGFKLNGTVYDKKYLTLWYYSLWYKYLYNNKYLLNIINQYDTFSDMFRRNNTRNCQSEVMSYVKKYGLKGLFDYVNPFFELVRKKECDKREL